MKRPLLSLICLAAAGLGFAAEYRFEPVVGAREARVTVSLNTASKSFHMPAWAPGDYELFNYGGRVGEINFWRDGKVVESKKLEDGNTWTIEGGADKVVYTVSESFGNFSPNLRVRPDETFVSGPGVFGWFDGDNDNPQTILIATPGSQWAEISLKKVDAPTGWQGFVARDYTELIDSPFVVGSELKTAEFVVGGKKHRMVGYGSSAGADMEAFASVAKPIVEAHLAMFGSLPYEQYIFFCDFNGGGGGLEHLSSTRLGIYSKDPRHAAGLISHEFFHTYNVKTIREKPLGPFDYTKPAAVSTLWWLEGVTDYYADVMLLRAGLVNEDGFVADLAGSYSQLLRNNARLRVTAQEASEKVWLTRGSQGWSGLSYYHKGKMIGVCLDLAIRLETQGTASLDDVMKALYEENKDGKPGYEPARLRELCIKFGGEKLGPIYDRCVTTTEELPFDDLLLRAGYRREGRAAQKVSSPSTINWPPIKPKS